MRQVRSDLRGFISELAAKAVSGDSFDQCVSHDDVEALRSLMSSAIRDFGDLDVQMNYRGSSRSGWALSPGAGDRAGSLLQPIELRALLSEEFWKTADFAEEFEYAPTMLQPVGGMDAIPRALARAVGEHKIVYSAKVTQLRRHNEGIHVEWRNQRGASFSALADAVICAVPAPALIRICTDLSPPRKRALENLNYAQACKLAFQCDHRFWEQRGIYGGISWTSRDATQIWYPASGFHKRKGIIVGAYIFEDAKCLRFAARSPVERAQHVVEDGERLHAGYIGHVTRPVSVAWGRIQNSLGSWGVYTEQQRKEEYKLLCSSEPPYFFAGEHLSWLTGWQEGAALSARDAAIGVAHWLQSRTDH
jgi:monoamine oxidase